LEKQGKGEEEENGDPEIDGIEKEIGERLLKLKNKINSVFFDECFSGFFPS